MTSSWSQSLDSVASISSSGERVFAMVVAYMDESGTHSGSHNSLVAGYWGSARQWKKFSALWGQILYKFSIEEFHAREYWKREHGAGVGPYRGWNKDRLNLFMAELLRVITRVKIFPFASGVLSEEWAKRQPFERRVLTGGSDRHSGAPNRSEFLGFQVCVLRVAQYCKPGTVAHFVMDNNPSTSGWATICYANLKKALEKDGDGLSSSLGPISFDDSKKAFPLQAADLLAYEAHQWAKKAYAKHDMNFPVRPIYQYALARFKSRDDFWLFDSPRFENLKRLSEVPETLKA